MGKGDLPRRKPGPHTAEEVLGPRGTTYSLRSATGPLKVLFKKKKPVKLIPKHTAVKR